jgi:hypothetical protein
MNSLPFVDARAVMERALLEQLGHRVNLLNIAYLWVAIDNVLFDVDGEFGGIKSYWRVFLRADTPLSLLLKELAADTDDSDGYASFYLACAFVQVAYEQRSSAHTVSSLHKRIAADFPQFARICDRFATAYDGSPKALFDTSVWSHRHDG